MNIWIFNGENGRLKGGLDKRLMPSIEKNGRIKKYIRNPKGYDLAHYRDMESAKAYDYRYSHLNYTSNHRL